MKPYLAIIKDSFRAALATKVLYLMLLLITGLLLVVAPLGIKEELTFRLTPRDIFDSATFSKSLVESSKTASAATEDSTSEDGPETSTESEKEAESEEDKDEPDEQKTPQQILWAQLSKNLQGDLRELFGRDGKLATGSQNNDQAFKRIRQIENSKRDLIREINELILDEDFHDWGLAKGVELSVEAAELVEEKANGLSDLKRRRLNRLLVSTAFPRDISEGTPTSLRVTYIKETPGAIPIRKQELVDYANQFIPYVLDKFVLSIGIFIAILVTAPMIPQTFEPGALNLLLSKPINRWAMFLAKFCGGCAFITICAAYLFVGIWFILGVRLGIWNNGLLISIPIYVFVFAIYFAVSACTALVFRNAIVSVVIAVLFWAACFGVGITRNILELRRGNYEITQIVDADSQTFAADVRHQTFLWSTKDSKWDIAFLSDEEKDLAQIYYYMGTPMPKLIGPIYDAKNERLIAAQTSLINAGNPLASNRWISYATQKGKWKYVESMPAPPYTMEIMLEPDGSLIAMTRLGNIFRLADPEVIKEKIVKRLEELDLEEGVGESTGEDDDSDDSASHNDDSINALLQNAMTSVGPSSTIPIGRPADVAMNRETGKIAVISRNMMYLLEKDSDGNYETTKSEELDLPGDKDLTVRMEFNSDAIMLARGNGDIALLDPKDLSVKKTFNPEETAAIRNASSSPDGRWMSVVFRNGALWIIDTKENTIKLANVSGQNSITTSSFSHDGDLMVALKSNQVDRYSIEDYKKGSARVPKIDIYESGYRYVLTPFYTICPKPGEFYPLVTHLSTKPSEEDRAGMERSGQGDDKNPWGPFYNGFFFMCVLLGIACFYIERQDF